MEETVISNRICRIDRSIVAAEPPPWTSKVGGSVDVVHIDQLQGDRNVHGGCKLFSGRILVSDSYIDKTCTCTRGENYISFYVYTAASNGMSNARVRLRS